VLSRSPVAQESDILAAAWLLLATARVADGDAQDVIVARCADVRPIKGGPPGRVSVTHDRTVRVTKLPGWPPGWERQDE
jgi:hypothetical protein